MAWYGNWAAVIASILFFTLFVVSLFTEMFGFPLTIFLLSSILGITIEPTGETGHLIAVALDSLGILQLEKGVFLVMAVSSIMILAGLALIILGWRKIHKAEGHGREVWGRVSEI